VILIFLSGAVSIILEITFLRIFGFVFGYTSKATAILLSVFFAGASLGGYVWGKYTQLTCRKINPRVTFIRLELLAGVTVLLSLLFYKFLYSGVYIPAIEYTAAVLFLFLPAFFLGGTLPTVLAGYPDAYRAEGLLYSAAALGAFFGALIGGFILLPLLGVNWTLALMSFLSFAIAGSAGRVSFPVLPEQGIEPTNNVSPQRRTFSSLPVSITLTILFITGFVGMGSEVVLMRLLGLVFGSTTYAFTILLAGFLAGIFIGSMIFVKVVNKITDATALLISILFSLALSLSLLPLTIGYLPILYLRIFQYSANSPLFYFLLQLILAASFLLIPTLFLGLSFPLLTAFALNERPSEMMGKVLGINYLGSIMGALSGGFLLIPFFGPQKSLYILIVLIVTGITFLIFSGKTNQKILPVCGILFVVLSMLLSPQWNRQVLNSGVHVYANDLISQGEKTKISVMDLYKNALRNCSILFYQDGANCSVAVTGRENGYLTLSIDGKADASTTPVDLPAQILLGHMGTLLSAKDTRNVFIVGLGSGMTLRNVLLYPEVTNVVVSEVEKAVVSASQLFRSAGGGIPDDGRIRIVVSDALHYLRRNDQKYDLIISEPSNPWMAGVSHLFTKEFYKLLKNRLNDDGVVVQWFHYYRMNPDDFLCALRTFHEVFPNSFLWSAAGGDVIITAYNNEETKIDWNNLCEKFYLPQVQNKLSELEISSPAEIVTRLICGPEDLKNNIESGPVNDEVFRRLEFSLPFSMYRRDLMIVNYQMLRKWSNTSPGYFVNLREPDDILDAFIQQNDIKNASLWMNTICSSDQKKEYFLGKLYMAESNYPPAEKLLSALYKQHFHDENLYVDLSSLYFRTKELRKSISVAKTGVRLFPRSAALHNQLGLVFHAQEDFVDAESCFSEAIKLSPHKASYLLNLANVYLATGDYASAKRIIDETIKKHPVNGMPYYFRGKYFVMAGNYLAAYNDFILAQNIQPSLYPLTQKFLSPRTKKQELQTHS